MPELEKILTIDAHTSMNHYCHGNIKKAAHYWNKIYEANPDSHTLAKVMRIFSDDAVFEITDYLKRKK